MRLDQFLFNKGLAKSRSQAIQIIELGLVTINNKVVNKSSFFINDEDVVEIKNQLKYVSRAGLKLEYALDFFKLDIKNNIVLDLGTSTGGFADVCLQNDISKIYCVDVGKDQIDNKIKNNKKVINLENTNIKNINDELISDEIDLIVSDLSFISSKYMFSSIKKIKTSNNLNIISLIKPQFELTKEIVNKRHGLINNQKYHEMAINNVKSYAYENGFKVVDIVESPIRGNKKQNKEFLIWCKHAN